MSAKDGFTKKFKNRDYDAFNFSDSIILLFATALLSPFGHIMEEYLLGDSEIPLTFHCLYVVLSFLFGLGTIALRIWYNRRAR